MIVKFVAVWLYLDMAFTHLVRREWKYFTQIGRKSMWAGAVMAAKKMSL